MGQEFGKGLSKGFLLMASQDVQVWGCREMSAGAMTRKDLTGLDVQDGALMGRS